MKAHILLYLSLLVFTLPSVAHANNIEKAISLEPEISLAPSYRPYPDDPDSLVCLFYEYLDQRNFRLAYKFVDSKAFGNLNDFSSDKGFGKVNHVLVKRLKRFSVYLMPDTLFLYFVQLLQLDISGRQENINVLLKVEKKKRRYKITDFSVIPGSKDDFQPEQFFKVSDDIMTFPATIVWTQQHEFYGSWVDTNYYVRSFLLDVHGEDEPVWSFIFIYRQLGSDYFLSDLYFGVSDSHSNNLFNRIYNTDNYFLLEVNRVSCRGGDTMYFYDFYTPWMQKVLGFASNFFVSKHVQDDSIYFQFYVDTISLFKKDRELFLKAKFNSEFSLYSGSTRDTLCGKNSYFTVYKFDFGKMEFREVAKIGDTTDIYQLISNGLFDKLKKYRVDCEGY